MKETLIAFLLINFIFIGSNAESYLMFPQHMLPPIGITYNLTVNAIVNEVPLSGIYAIQAITTQDMKTTIGYRMWQGYSGEINEIVYTVSYKNGTGFQAAVDPRTHQCENIYHQRINCTGWSNINILRWNNLCIDHSTEEYHSIARMTVDADASDLKRPVSLNVTITTDGSPYTIIATYQFSSKTEGKNFPSVKCAF